MNLPNAIQMTSREIAKVTGKRHDNILRDIENMFDDLKVSRLSFEGTYFDTQNKQRKEYVLDKDHTICLISGYDARLRMLMIQHINSLEQQIRDQSPSVPDFLDPAAAAIAWAEQYTKSKELQQLVDDFKPLAEITTKLITQDDLFATVDVAKKLGVTSIALNRFLRDKGIKMKTKDRYMNGYEDWFKIVKVDIGNGKWKDQCKITAMGELEIIRAWNNK